METETVEIPQGFRLLALEGGIKYAGRKDIGLIISTRPCSYAGAFTTNRVQAAPVRLCRERLGQSIHAVIVNSGSANACTGDEGYRDAVTITRHVEKGFGLPKGSALSLSTGVIGVPLPVAKFEAALADTSHAETGPEAFARSIMTTDTVPKMAARTVALPGGRSVKIAGFAKGAGMISPNMATMLAFVITDADISTKKLQKYVLDNLEDSFNAVTVDGDMSTNDSLVVLANGASQTTLQDKEERRAFKKALFEVMESLALQVVRDGEGATKCIEILVEGAKSRKDAEITARAIANSLLVKTAFFGNDPNWGRIIDVAGYSGADVRENRMELFYLDRVIFSRGKPLPFDKKELSSKLAATKDIKIRLSLGEGRYSRRLYTTDLSYDYVKINAEYTT
ncbi:MAG TPA: bifunctional glutamate N-acetyltransferase/amino-acid acetyltransferase ArgJ [Spirochaetota bacterium]|mgnify:CR=1 FL=1|nr:bifunctional glutamate N-acetyltransferase/amino-acid acetyltransferase ArgJ [Spirochaetota bacterium]HPN82531.1 bifunctional glutamate N-acetyltransferase/amino-acid acetyltransferase ArgJ [Spirochaetota bacterium]